MFRVAWSPWSLSTWGSTPVFEPHAFPSKIHAFQSIIRCNWSPHSSVVENAFGCQSACAQTALPPGPAFGAASAYEKYIFDGGPSMYMYMYIYIYWLVVLTPLKMLKVNGKDDIPYMKWKIKNVPNHQPVYIYISNICFNNSV